MKKIILLITLVVAIVASIFAIIEVKNYYDKKNKIDNNTIIQEVGEKTKELENTIKEKEAQEKKVKEEKKEKIEEFETWQKNAKEISENL